MKEINIAKTLVSKRKEKGITQDELAEYVGVSKASVSKWETASSYPDITILPQLATYFNISVDELIGYEPQMAKNDIKKLYRRFSSDFSKKPFDDVIAEIHEVIKKYYSCFPLLLQMVILLLNHYMIAEDKNKQDDILAEILELCVRIKNESDDLWLSKQANSIQATALLILQRPVEVIELLGEDIRPLFNEDELLATAYLRQGKIQKANEVLQIGIYQHVLNLVNFLVNYLYINSSDPDKFEIIHTRLDTIIKTFEFDNLSPNAVLQMQLILAQTYAMQGNAEAS